MASPRNQASIALIHNSSAGSEDVVLHTNSLDHLETQLSILPSITRRIADAGTIRRARLRPLQLRIRGLQTQCRDLGLRFYDLSTQKRTSLIGRGDTIVSRSYEVPMHALPGPPFAARLNRVSQRLEEVTGLVSQGADEEFSRILHEESLEIRILWQLQTEVHGKILQAERRHARDPHSTLQQARDGHAPAQFTTWCRCLREVQQALTLGTISDDANEIVQFVVQEEERPEPPEIRGSLPVYTTQSFMTV